MIICYFCKSQLECKFEDKVLTKNIYCHECSFLNKDHKIEVLYFVTRAGSVSGPYNIWTCSVEIDNYQVEIYPHDKTMDIYLNMSLNDNRAFKTIIPTFFNIKDFVDSTSKLIERLLKNKAFL